LIYFIIKNFFEYETVRNTHPLHLSMEEYLLISDDCIGCGLCTKVCIRGHIVLADGRPQEIDSGYSCFECGHCAAVCPKGAI